MNSATPAGNVGPSPPAAPSGKEALPLSNAPASTSAFSHTGATDFSKSRTVAAAPRHDRLVDLITVGLCLAAVALLSLIDLQRPHVVDPGEALTMAVSEDTWRRPADDALDRLVPHLNDQAQFDRAPGITWLHQAAFRLTGRRNATTDVSSLILRARLVSVVLALLSVGAVYWAGRSIGGIRTARFGALICAANPVFIYYARLAGPSMAQMALTLLAVAAALWAIRPLKPAPSLWRQGVGWTIAGVALGAALLTAGPVALLTFGLPVLVVVLCPNRMSHLLGIVAAVCIGVLIATPWALYAHDHDPAVTQAWRAHLFSRGHLSSGFAALAALEISRFWIVLAVLIPWTLWALGALGQPFTASSQGLRLRLLVGWSWFVIIVVLVLFRPVFGVLGDFLLIVPVGSVLLGQLFDRYCDLAAEGRYPRFWSRMRWPHLALLLALTILAPLLLHDPQWPVQLGWLRRPLWDPAPWWVAAGLMIALGAILFLSARWAYRHFPGKALAGWAVWLGALLLVVLVPVTRGPAFSHSLNQDGRTLAAMTTSGSVFLVEAHAPVQPLTQRTAPPTAVDPRLLLYSGRDIPLVTSRQVALVQPESRNVFLLAPQSIDQTAMDALLGAGHGEMSFKATLPGAGMNLWLLTTTAAAPMPAETTGHVQ